MWLLPSVLYWTVYLILSVTNKWDEPYSFSVSKSKAVNDIAQVAFGPALCGVVCFHNNITVGNQIVAIYGEPPLREVNP